jgi:protein gp37
MKNSSISWTNDTRNFWWGCSYAGPECLNCYAETLSKRFGYDLWGPKQPRQVKKAVWDDIIKADNQYRSMGITKRAFINSMSDFFEDHPDIKQWRNEAIDILSSLTNTVAQVLTKRPENITTMAPR